MAHCDAAVCLCVYVSKAGEGDPCVWNGHSGDRRRGRAHGAQMGVRLWLLLRRLAPARTPSQAKGIASGASKHDEERLTLTIMYVGVMLNMGS